MKSTNESRMRRINGREHIDKYVFEPSRDYGSAWGLVGFGLGLTILGVFTAPMFPPLAAISFVLSITASFAGVGWMLMIKERLSAYKNDVMDALTEDRKTAYENIDQRPPGIKTIPVTTGGKRSTLELNEYNPLVASEWIAVAAAVMHRGADISEKSLCRDEDVLTQPKYKQFFSYMRQGVAPYMQVVKGKNKLTERGETYLMGYLPQ